LMCEVPLRPTHDGATPLTNNVRGKIAFVERGAVDFITKVSTLQWYLAHKRTHPSRTLHQDCV